jgi:hypothetical protein
MFVRFISSTYISLNIPSLVPRWTCMTLRLQLSVDSKQEMALAGAGNFGNAGNLVVSADFNYACQIPAAEI